MIKRTYLCLVVLCLLLVGCQPSQERANQRLILAIQNWDYEAAQSALQAGANPNAVSSYDRRENKIYIPKGQSIMQWAAQSGMDSMVELMAANGGDLRASFRGHSPLRYFVSQNRIHVMRRLLERDASILAPPTDSASLLQDAIAGEQFDMARLLLRYGAAHGVALSHPMLDKMASEGKPNSLQFMLETEAAFKKPEVFRRLLPLAQQGHKKIAKMYPNTPMVRRAQETIALLRQSLAKSQS